MKLVYPAVFSALEESSGYCVTFPDLAGCVTQGNNIADAITMAVDAASGWVLAKKLNCPIGEVLLIGQFF